MILQHEEKRTLPTAKDGKNKESHHQKIFMLSIYVIIVVEVRVKQLKEGRKGWNDNIKICLDESHLWMKTGIKASGSNSILGVSTENTGFFETIVGG